MTKTWSPDEKKYISQLCYPITFDFAYVFRDFVLMEKEFKLDSYKEIGFIQGSLNVINISSVRSARDLIMLIDEE